MAVAAADVADALTITRPAVTYPAGVTAQHRVLVPKYQQFGILRQVRAEHQDG